MRKVQERKPGENGGRDIADTLMKMGQEMSEYVKKTAEKRYRDIFKDIEIKLREFFLLSFIGLSLSAILIVNTVGFVQFFRNDFTQFLGVSGIMVGFIIGLVMSSFLLHRIEKRYPFLAIILIFSSLIQFAYPWLSANETPVVLQIVVMVINGFNFGITVIIYATLFIESTTIMERGRVIALNFILIFIGAMIFAFFVITGFLNNLEPDIQMGVYLVAAVPIGTAIYLARIQRSEKIHPKRPEISPKVPVKVTIRNKKTLLFYAVIFFAFSVSIGLFFPIGEVEHIFLTSGGDQTRLILILTLSSILVVIILFIIGYAYDFLGRRIVIGISVTFLGLMNYTQIYLGIYEPLIIAITFIMALIMAIPLIVGDFSLQSEVPTANASFLLITLSGSLLGVFLKGHFLETGTRQATVMALAILVLFILMNTRETISSKERSWPEMLFHLFVIHESGMLLYEHSFKDIRTGVESDLISGGIVGLTAILEEIVRGNQRLRIIDHGDKKILFRFSSDLKIIYVLLITDDLLVIRNKLKAFAEAFETHFADQIAKLGGVRLETWSGTKDLVQKYFERKYFLV